MGMDMSSLDQNWDYPITTEQQTPEEKKKYHNRREQLIFFSGSQVNLWLFLRRSPAPIAAFTFWNLIVHLENRIYPTMTLFTYTFQILICNN